ncbi:hypothetical protein DFH27DRAFT_553238 [Peziza echinospora]|nr:hypothetical protein DFH27DRAFT_553238 [Peziza echinospora]
MTREMVTCVMPFLQLLVIGGSSAVVCRWSGWRQVSHCRLALGGLCCASLPAWRGVGMARRGSNWTVGAIWATEGGTAK